MASFWDMLSPLGDLYGAWKRGSDQYPQQLGSDPMSISNLANTYQSTPGLEMAGGFGPGDIGMLGGIKVFHGSPHSDLNTIQASPLNRQFDNSTSQLGGFFSPNETVAQRYAGKEGAVYSADLDLKNPYEMSIGEFTRLQSPNRGPEGESLPPEQWQARYDALKQEGAALRKTLSDAGHDGVIVRNRHGVPIEYASFNDVPISSKLLK